MPVDHRLLGKPIVESDVEILAGVEGEARLAIRTDKSIDLGRAATDFDGAAVDGQDAGRGGAGGQGGADMAGMTSAVYLYRLAFDFNDLGGASAMSWLLFVLVVAMTWLTNRAFKEPGA